MTMLRFCVASGWLLVAANALVPFAPIVSFTRRTTTPRRSVIRWAAPPTDTDSGNKNSDSLSPSSLLSKLSSLESLPNPFSNLDPNPPLTLPQSLTGEWEATPQGLIQRAKLVLSTDFAIRDPTLLEESFFWIGPTVDKPLNKIDYLAAGRFFDLRQAFPDLDFRPHDFRIDEQDPNTVRITVRTVGTLRGELRLRNAILPPNGQRMKCPPESITMTFNPATGKLVKLCSGFCMDRLVGNTAGTCGVMAAATIAGSPPSDLELYPPLTVLERFFGRPTPPLEEATTFLAPFPETVMIQLAKGIIAANMAANDPTLLTASFTYVTPYQGPIAKRQYIESFAAQLFADVDPELSHFRVDPYDPYRVWVDVLPLAPGFIGPPQAMSFTFDDEGFCTRITSGAVMDPSLGNGGGLGGPEGYKYAKGEPSLGIATRPLPRLLGRLRKKILEPITGIGVDDYALSSDQIIKYELEYDDAEDEDDEPAAPFISSTVRRSQLNLDVEQDAAQLRSAAIAAAAEKRQKEMEEARKAQTELALKRKLEIEKQQQDKKAKLEQQRKELEAAKRAKAEAIEKERQRKLAEAAKKKMAPVTRKPPVDSKKVTATKTSTITTPSGPKLNLLGFLGGVSPVSSSPTARTDQTKSKAKAETEALAKLRRQQEEERRAKSAKAAAERAEQLRKQQLAAQQKRDAETKARADLAAEKQRKQKEEQERKLAEAAAAKAKLVAEQERRKQIETEMQKAARLNRQQQVEAALRAKEAKTAADRAADLLRKQKEDQKQKAVADARARAEQAADQQRKQQLEQQRKLAEATKAKAKLEEEQERKRREAERKAREAEAKAAAERAAEENRKLEEERRLKAAAEKAAAARAAEEKKKQEEAKKAELARADAERRQRLERQQAAEARKAVAEQKQREAESKRTVQEQAKRAAAEQKLKLANDVKRLKVATQAPRGVPTLISWKQRSDGGITGKIYGSPNFADGERIETSPIVSGALESGNVVITGSGSRYFLSADSSLTVVNKAAAIKDMAAAKPGSTIALTRAQRERNAKEAEEAIRSAKPRSTISLFGLAGFGGGSSDDDLTPPRVKKTAPRGIPTITKWRKNTDGSLTGNISGSPKFSEGERITTSPIVSGNLAFGEVVTTGSGSRYFLS